MDWNFKREESNFGPMPVGNYRIRIKNVEKKVSSKGNDMLSFQFDVSGQAGYLFHNITFLKDRPEITNRNLTQFFDSFKDIPVGDFTLANWIGKVGACKVKHEEYNGDMQARVDRFIKAEEQTSLPAWQEPQRKSDGTAQTQAQSGPTNFTSVADANMEIPF